MLPILYHLYDPKVTWERKICWKGKILVVKTYLIHEIQEMDMDVYRGWGPNRRSLCIHPLPMILGSPIPLIPYPDV